MDTPIQDNIEDVETNDIDTELEDEFSNFELIEDEQQEEEEKSTEEESQEEEFDEIDYNKEKIKIPVKDRKVYLQKGYNYDKKAAQADELSRKLIEIEKVTGMTYEQILEQQKEQALNQEAEKLQEKYGIDEDLALEMARQRKDLEEIKAEKAILKLNEQNKQEIDSWKSKENPAIFNAIEKQAYEVMQVNNVSFDIAYRHVRGGMTYDELSNIANKNVKQSVIADVQDNLRRGKSVITNADSNKADEKTAKSSFVKAFNKFAGI